MRKLRVRTVAREKIDSRGMDTVVELVDGDTVTRIDGVLGLRIRVDSRRELVLISLKMHPGNIDLDVSGIEEECDSS